MNIEDNGVRLKVLEIVTRKSVTNIFVKPAFAKSDINGIEIVWSIY